MSRQRRKPTWRTSFLYTLPSRSGPSSVCFRKASRTETMMTASSVSRKTTRKTGTEKTSGAIMYGWVCKVCCEGSQVGRGKPRGRGNGGGSACTASQARGGQYDQKGTTVPLRLGLSRGRGCEAPSDKLRDDQITDKGGRGGGEFGGHHGHVQALRRRTDRTPAEVSPVPEQRRPRPSLG